jgi:peptide/nickel transport system permease protein
MARYIFRRLLLIPPMLVAITFIIFALVNISPIEPGAIILGAEAGPAEIAQVNHELGFDQPFIFRYGKFLIGAVQGDLGYSYYSKRPVLKEVLARVPNTLRLTFGVIFIAIVVGLPLGVLCAVYQYSWIDNILSSLAMFSGAMPFFWLGLLLMLTFSLRFDLLPAQGIESGWKSWVLPTATLCVVYISIYLRYTRSSLLDTIRQDYVRTARSKGCTERDVIFRHALRNALMPLVTITGLFIGTLMSSAVVIESVFAIPGLGLLVLDSIKRKDIPMVMGCIVLLAIIFFVITLVMDVLYAYIDPRIGASYGSNSKKKLKMPKTASLEAK